MIKKKITENHFDKVFSEKEDIEYNFDTNRIGIKDRKIIEFLKKHGIEGKKCLDVGPGTGRWIKFLRKMDSGSITGIDISDKAIEKFKPYCDEVIKIDIEKEDFNLPSDTFDVVISFEVLEHLFDPMKYLSEIFRVMSEGAVLLMSTPNLTSLISRMRMIVGKLPIAISSDPTHVRFYRKKDIKDLFNSINRDVRFIPTSISLNLRNPKSKIYIPSSKAISSFDDSLVFYVFKK